MTEYSYPSRKAILSLESSDWWGSLANTESKCFPNFSYLVGDDDPLWYTWSMFLPAPSSRCLTAHLGLPWHRLDWPQCTSEKSWWGHFAVCLRVGKGLLCSPLNSQHLPCDGHRRCLVNIKKWISLNFAISHQKTQKTWMWKLLLDLWILNLILKDIQDSLQQNRYDHTLNPVVSARCKYQILCWAFAMGLYLKRCYLLYHMAIPPEIFLESFGLLYNPPNTRTMLGRFWIDKVFHTWFVWGTHKYLRNKWMMVEREAFWKYIFNCINFVV